MRQKLRLIAMLAALAVMLFSGYKLYTLSAEYARDRDAYSQTAQQFVQTLPPATEPSGSTPSDPATEPTRPREYAPVTVDFEALGQTSEHIVGWLYCPDTNINYPVVQSGNNSDFLRAAPDGSYRYAGSIFLDYRCPGDFSGQNSILYGHNLLDESMFGTLERYREQDHYEAHPVMYLLTPEKDYRVDLIAGLALDARSALYRTDHTEESYRSFLDTVLAESDFHAPTEELDLSRTLTLSTCAYEYDDARYIVVGVLTELDRPD